MKILVRLPNWLGDIVMSMAFIDALNRIYPNCWIFIIVKKELKDLFSNDPRLKGVFGFSKNDFPGVLGLWKFGSQITKEHKFDLFFCLPNSFSSALMGYFTGSKVRVGYKKELRDFLLTHSFSEVDEVHRVDAYTQLLSQFAELPLDEPKVEIQTSSMTSYQLPSGENLLLNVHSEADSRRMPISLAVKIVNQLSGYGPFNIVLTGSPKEVEYSQLIEAKISGLVPVYNYTGKTTLMELIALIRNLDFVVSTDSGIAHVSNALSIPTVVLFGAGNPANTRPYNLRYLEVIRKEDLECSPCVSNHCRLKTTACLNELDVSRVKKAFEVLYSKVRADKSIR